MSLTTLFLITFSVSLIVYWVIAVEFVAPWIAKLSVWDAMQILLVPHLFHQVGLATLDNSIVRSEFPTSLSWTVGIGDLAVLFSALLAAVALHHRSSRAAGLLWLFTLVGAVYNSYAGWLVFKNFQPSVTGLGTHWYIGAVYVPLLIVSHMMVFYNQVRRRKELRESSTPRRRRRAKAVRARSSAFTS